MTEFVRVRAATGLRHEFDVAVELVADQPSRFVVLDETPVKSPRPTKFDRRRARARERPKSVGKQKKETPDAAA